MFRAQTYVFFGLTHVNLDCKWMYYLKTYPFCEVACYKNTDVVGFAFCWFINGKIYVYNTGWTITNRLFVPKYENRAKYAMVKCCLSFPDQRIKNTVLI